MSEANLMATLNRLQPGVNEIMCHPGMTFVGPGHHVPGRQERYVRWGYSWDDELAALTSEPVRRYIEDSGIRLTSFADAWA